MASVVHLIGKSFLSKVHANRTLPFLNHLHYVKVSKTSSVPNQDSSEEFVMPPENEETAMSEEDLMKKRDISRLKPEFRAIVHNQPLPFTPRPNHRFDDSLSVQRQLYGKYGSRIGVNPAVCFMTKEEIEDIQEYEKVAHTEHILDIRKQKLEELAEEKKQYAVREAHYEKMMATMEQHKKRLREKIMSKLNAAEEAKKKRETLLEEVKRHFGYTIDPKDEKFQLMLEQKEKEQKKLNKEMKKKKREEYFMAKLASLESGQESASSPTNEKSKTYRKQVTIENNSENDSDDESEQKN